MKEILNYIDSIKLTTEKNSFDQGFSCALTLIENFILENPHLSIQEEKVFSQHTNSNTNQNTIIN